jgi:hypothetical protein
MDSFPDTARQLFCTARLSNDDMVASSLRRAAQRGALTRVRRGVYSALAVAPDAPTAEERAAARRAAFLRRVVAVGATRRASVVFSHYAAAAVWGLPVISGWPAAVDVLALPGSARRSKNGVVVHHREFDASDVIPWGEFWVTSPVRTIVDLARDGRYTDAVVALDWMLNPDRATPELIATKSEVVACASRWSARGDRRLDRAVEFANGASGSPRESLSRILIDELGFPAPELQVVQLIPGGTYFATDFEWPDRKLIGEYDGAGKYLKPEYLQGRTPGEAVIDEKRREDFLRDEGNGVVRWGKQETRDPWALRRLLLSKGLPIVRRPRWTGGALP